MSARGARFLENWVRENVKVVAFPRKETESIPLVLLCISDAARQHISEHELSDTVGNLAAFMFKAMGDSATAAAADKGGLTIKSAPQRQRGNLE